MRVAGGAHRRGSVVPIGIRIAAGLFAAGALLTACARTPEQRFVNGVANALGGSRAVSGAATLLLEGDGESYYLGENRNPDADLPVFRTKFRQAFDWEHRRFRKEELRLAQFVSGSTGLRQVTTALDGDVAFDVGSDLKAAKQPAWTARDRQSELLRHPIGFLRAALAPNARVSHLRTAGTRQLADLTTADGDTLTMAVDRTTLLPSSISSAAAHPVLGDVTAETEFAGYERVGGVMLPTRITERLDGRVIARVHILRQTPGIDPDAPLPTPLFAAFPEEVRLEAPAALESAQPESDTALAVEPLAPGVWRLTGNQYASVLVEGADRDVLVEAPLDDARTAALLAKAKELTPGKPLTALVVTHHHFDHIGGVRGAVAAGLTVFVAGHPAERAGDLVASRPAAAAGDTATFIEEIVRRPHTRVPDELARHPKALHIETVDARRTLGDAAQPVDLFPISGSAYADTLLMAYLPRPRLLIEADVYTPPNEGSRESAYPFAANLIENVQRQHLSVDRIVPLHGPVVSWATLLAAAERPPAAAAVIP
jgi:metallo-beta-lactamase superfamily protein